MSCKNYKNIMNPSIIRFIQKQKTATVSCVNELCEPYCFSCFYYFNPDKQLLYFKSSASVYHSKLILERPRVAGTILPDKLNVLAIKGIQFTGVVLNAFDALCSDATEQYHKKFPFAKAMPGEVWTIQVNSIKMTDNTLSFGKKLTWERNDVLSTVH
jgi:uncharacterized protein